MSVCCRSIGLGVSRNRHALVCIPRHAVQDGVGSWTTRARNIDNRGRTKGQRGHVSVIVERVCVWVMKACISKVNGVGTIPKMAPRLLSPVGVGASIETISCREGVRPDRSCRLRLRLPRPDVACGVAARITSVCGVSWSIDVRIVLIKLADERNDMGPSRSSARQADAVVDFIHPVMGLTGVHLLKISSARDVHVRVRKLTRRNWQGE